MDANSAGSMGRGGVIKVLIYVNLWMSFPLVGEGKLLFCFEDTVSLSIPITRHDFCQTPLYNSGVTRFES